MPNPKDFNLNYRPETYWQDETSGFVTIKGEMRRRIVDKAFREGEFDTLPASIFSDKLSQDERLMIGSIHPAFMGGEYLPDYPSDEIEIVRISLESVTWDVYSIRAKKSRDGLIHYSVVDEYGSWENGIFILHPATSVKPFTFGEMVSFIDDVEWTASGGADKGLTAGFRDMNYDLVGPGKRELEELVNFVHVSSYFYPELERWYENEALEWFITCLTELESED